MRVIMKKEITNQRSMNEEDYLISCCSATDLTQDELNDNNIHVIEFDVIKDKDGRRTTSQINPYRFEEYFGEITKHGKSLLHIALSSGLSGTFNNAYIAAQTVNERNEEDGIAGKIYVVDSLAASCGFGMLVLLAARNRSNGMGIEDNVKLIESNKLKLNHIFTSTDLSSYYKSGRISKTCELIGSALNFCPIMKVDEFGKLVSIERTRGIRGVKRAINRMKDEMLSKCRDGVNYYGECYIAHSNCAELANRLKYLAENEIVNLKDKIRVRSIGPTISAHSGDGTIAIFFFGTERLKTN